MVAFSKADRLLGQYKTVYGDDNDANVEFMCGEYANEWAALATAMVDIAVPGNPTCVVGCHVGQIRQPQPVDGPSPLTQQRSQ